MSRPWTARLRPNSDSNKPAIVQRLGHRGFTLHQLVMGLGGGLLVVCLVLAYQQSQHSNQQSSGSGSITSMLPSAGHG